MHNGHLLLEFVVLLLEFGSVYLHLVVHVLLEAGGDSLGDILNATHAALLRCLSLKEFFLELPLNVLGRVALVERPEEGRAKELDDEGVVEGHSDVGD